MSNSKILFVAFCLIVLAMAGVASAATVTINLDKTININGKKTFPVYIYGMCESHFESNCGVGTCDPSKNSEFTFSLGPHYSGERVTNYYTPIFNAANELFVARAGSEYTSVVTTSSSIFGYINYDEPELNDKTTGDVNSEYLKSKANDPNHPVILNICCSKASKWMPYTDILSWDLYTIKGTHAKDASGNEITDETICTSNGYFWDNVHLICYQWLRSDAIYAYEHYSHYGIGLPSAESLGKPIYAVLQGNGIRAGDLFVPTPQEIRANSYTAITMNVNGIGYWGYLTWGGSDHSTTEFPYCTSGLYNDISLHNYYRQLGKEITELNDILVLPTTDYSWEYRKGTTVHFDKVLKPDVSVLWNADRTNFNYIMKQDADKTYLIIVNKDSRSISDVEITVDGLSGSMNAKTLGLVSAGSVPGRMIPVDNGKFTDSFEGYAAHIYMISCTPNWQCESPFNGNESDGCGNRRVNSMCDLPIPARCLVFQKWKVVCTMIYQFCVMNDVPDTFCTGQKNTCLQKVDDLIAKCRQVF